MRFRREVPHTLAGAYALDALTEADRARFERHLAECDVCHQEAGSLREAAAWLPAVTATAPPARVRAQVLAAVAGTRQLPSVTGEGRAGAGDRHRGFRPMAPRLAVAVTGGCMLVALVLGGLFVNTQHRLSQEQAHSGAIAAVLNSPDATMMSVHAPTGGTATVVMSHSDHALVLTTARLPALPAGRRYQIWLMRQGTMRPAGMLPAPRQGMTAPVVVAGVAAGDGIGLSVEPAAGSAHPTSRPVLILVLPS